MTEPHPPRRGFLAGLRASFLTGLVVVLPIGLTIYVVWAVIGWIDGWILPLIPSYWQPDVVIRRWFGPDYRRSEVFAHIGGFPLGLAMDRDGDMVFMARSAQTRTAVSVWFRGASSARVSASSRRHSIPTAP